MACRCEVCGKGPIYGCAISHSHRVTNRRWEPNLHRLKVIINGQRRRAKVCTACLRSGRVERYL
ncbi:MAG: 50S ribosomal protein L28 [Candidatus Schekmanbacteria bacterium]|nr:50S ribosomal protein L28 [Candidatus Schekmanbacteria bacterium]